MFRPAIGTLIIAATLAIAGQAAAELPMSPIYRTDQASGSDRSAPRLGEHGNPISAAGKGETAHPAQTAEPESAERVPMAKAAGAKVTDSAKIVATALIPPLPPPPTQPPPAEPPPTQSAGEPAEPAAAPSHKPHHAPHPHYAASRYPSSYRYYSAWGASNPPHLGPNPYSPNGGD